VGAFYSWPDWTIRGVVIRYNFIHDTICGVNPDDSAADNLVFGNIFTGYRTGVWIASVPDGVNKVVTMQKIASKSNKQPLNKSCVRFLAAVFQSPEISLNGV